MTNWVKNSLTCLPIVVLLTFNLSVFYGLQSHSNHPFLFVPNTFLGEMFTANMKNMTSLFVSSRNAVLPFAIAKSYHPLLDFLKYNR